MWRRKCVPQDFTNIHSSISTNATATDNSLITTEESRCLIPPENSSVASFSTVSVTISKSTSLGKPAWLPTPLCTTDTVFAARQLHEKCQKMWTHLHTAFLDLTKAFDKVDREGLKKVMQKFGFPQRFTHVLHQRRRGMMTLVTENRAVSEASAVTSGVEQAYVLAPVLFNLMSSSMLMDPHRP
ncbi:hypothetical protein SprV_0902677800 [Sparganum proliferum]